MANFNNLALTAEGLKALLAAQAGTTLTLSKIGLGSGSTTSSTVNLTGLVTPELMLSISGKKIDSTSGHITLVAKMTNEEITEGFYWRETGLFFEDSEGNDVLFAYSCVTSEYDYIPAYSDQRYVKHIRIANIITDSADITIKENEGLLYVDTLTFEEYQEYVAGELEKKASIITSATTVYVSTGGSDDNAGTEDAPLKTIQEAINRCPVITGVQSEDNAEMHYTISIAEGTYDERIGIVGKRMSITTDGVVIVTKMTVSSAGQVTLKGEFHFDNAGDNCITLYNSKLYCFGNLKVLAGSIGIILAEGSSVVCRGGTVDINNTTWSGVQIEDAGICYIETLTGAGNTGAGIRCAKGIAWVATNTLVTSGTGIVSTDGGIVNTGALNTTTKTLFGAINEIYNKAVIGTDRVYINENDDLNAFVECGGYKCAYSSVVESLSNCPVNEAFILDVVPSTGEHSKLDTSIHSYITQHLETLNGLHYYRIIHSNPTSSTLFGEWVKDLSAVDIVDNLLSTATNLPLSANQGRVLQEQVTELNTKIPVKTYGEVTVTTVAGVWTTASISFGHTYSITPLVNIMLRSLHLSVEFVVNGITTTGASVQIYKDTAADVTFYWQALGY